jgi:uncharacterized protein YbjT (DUF2867 family)
MTGEGVAEAVKGAAVVVDVSNSPSLDDGVAMTFFETSSRNLFPAEAAAGVRHHLALSIVGVDRLRDGGYFRAKVAQENLIKASGMPYTILRSTQFFEFIGTIAESGSDKIVVRVPAAHLRPIASDDVVEVLADLALGPPANATVEVAGPEPFPLDHLARQVLAAKNDRRRVVVDSDARYFGARLNEGSLLPGDHPRIAPTRFGDWLGHRFA